MGALIAIAIAVANDLLSDSSKALKEGNGNESKILSLLLKVYNQISLTQSTVCFSLSITPDNSSPFDFFKDPDETPLQFRYGNQSSSLITDILAEILENGTPVTELSSLVLEQAFGKGTTGFTYTYTNNKKLYFVSGNRHGYQWSLTASSADE